MSDVLFFKQLDISTIEILKSNHFSLENNLFISLNILRFLRLSLVNRNNIF